MRPLARPVADGDSTMTSQSIIFTRSGRRPPMAEQRANGALPRLSSPTVHCPDAPALARFYADLTGGAVTFASAGWAVVNGPNGRIDFQTVTDFEPPTWPDGDSPIHLHLDFY